MNTPWSCLLPAQRESAFLHIACTPDSGARLPSSSSTASSGQALRVSGTQTVDRLTITLMHLGDGRGGAELRVYATRAPIQVGSMTPSGMEPAMYCQLVDDVLRWPAEDATNEVQISAPVPPPRAASAKVELRLVSHTKSVSLLLSSLDLYAVEQPTSQVVSVLGACGGALRQLNSLSAQGAVWQEEQQRLRRQIEVVTAGQLAERDEGLLMGVQKIVNAKKDKIRELTVALHTQTQTQTQAQGQARALVDTASDTDSTHASEEEQQPPQHQQQKQQKRSVKMTQPTLGESYRTLPGEEETLQDTYMVPHETLDEMAMPSGGDQSGQGAKGASRKRGRSGKGEEDWLEDLYAIE